MKFTGYLTNSDYDAELANCDVVMALTTRDHTMQRAGYEAIAAAKPQVTADFKVLRDFHADAAIYVDPHSHADIARGGVREALSNSGGRSLLGFADVSNRFWPTSRLQSKSCGAPSSPPKGRATEQRAA